MNPTVLGCLADTPPSPSGRVLGGVKSEFSVQQAPSGAAMYSQVSHSLVSLTSSAVSPCWAALSFRGEVPSVVYPRPLVETGVFRHSFSYAKCSKWDWIPAPFSLSAVSTLQPLQAFSESFLASYVLQRQSFRLASPSTTIQVSCICVCVWPVMPKDPPISNSPSWDYK